MRSNLIIVLMAFLMAVGLSAAVSVSSCTEITSPGTYDLAADLSGTNVSLDAPLGSSSACIRISANDVVLDCHGHSISSGILPDTYGIAVQKNGTAYITGVTVKNCNISGYSGGILAYQANNSRFTGNSLNQNALNNTYFSFPNGGVGLALAGYCGNDTIDDNYAYGNFNGFRVSDGDRIVLRDNIAEGNLLSTPNGIRGVGFWMYMSNGNVTDNGASGSFRNFRLEGGENNSFAGNDADNGTDTGFYVSGTHNKFSGNSAFNNDYAGFYFDDSEYDCGFNTLTGNSVDGNGASYGFNIQNCNYSLIQDNNVTDSEDGIYLSGSTFNNLTQNNVIDNYYGIHLYLSDYNNVFSNLINESEYGVYVWEADSNWIGFNRIYNTNYANYGSCPFLYTYDGSSYGFVVEISGASLLGRSLGNGVYRRPMAGDYTLVKSGQLQPANGSYSVKVTQEYDEISYIDEIALKTVDHSPEVDILPTLVTSQNGKIYTVSKAPSAPVSCVDADGNDCLPAVISKDDDYTPLASGRSNVLELDLGNLSGASETKLIVSGYSSFAGYSSPYHDKKIQVKDESGEWVDVYSGSQLAFPPEFPTTNVIDLTGRFPTSDHHVRVIFDLSSFDYIAVDTTPQQPLTVNTYYPSSADLHFRGYSDAAAGQLPIPEYDQVWDSISASTPSGNFTKYGNVLPLLGSADDEFVIMHHGDEISLEFPYAPASAGQERDYIFYNWAYSKPAKNIYGNTVDPLPFKAMSNYPYAAGESYPSDAEHASYLAEWNTRYYDGEPGESSGMSLPLSYNNTVSYNTIVGNNWSIGLYLDEEEETKLYYNSISNVETGIDIYDSFDTEVLGNTISCIGGRGIIIHQDSEETTVTGNTVTSDSTEYCEYEGGCGAIYLGRTDWNTIQGNTLTALYGTGIAAGYSDYNDFLDNIITSTGEDYYSIDTWGSDENLFLHNTIISDYWVSDSSEDSNYYNDSTSGNRYYFANGTGAWTLFNISDDNGDGWADVGSDLPFSCATVGYCETDYQYWSGEGEDWHPFVAGLTGPHQEPQKKSLSIGIDSSCNSTAVTVSADGDPVNGASVSVDGVGIGNTDSDGMVEFAGECGDSVRIHAVLGGYLPADKTVDLISCGGCAPPECTADTDCPIDQRCVEQKCVPVPCDCGRVGDHQCTPYACCSDSQCASDETCVDHACTKKPEEGCRSDLNCKDNEYCDIKPGQNTGSCLPVQPGECGTVTNHAFVAYDYQCANETGCQISCPDDLSCVDHKCVEIGLTCPSTGIVGANQTCAATEGGAPYANSDCVVTDPAGKNITCRTDENGNINVPLDMEGTYRVAILKDGGVVKIMEIKASPQPKAGGETPPPTAAGPDATPLIGLFLLLLLIVIGAIYWRGRSQKK